MIESSLLHMPGAVLSLCTGIVVIADSDRCHDVLVMFLIVLRCTLPHKNFVCFY